MDLLPPSSLKALRAQASGVHDWDFDLKIGDDRALARGACTWILASPIIVPIHY